MLSVRNCEQDDVRNLTVMINSTSGAAIFKAIFGAFHLPSLLDNCYLSLVSEVVSDVSNSNQTMTVNPIRGFLAVNDYIPTLGDKGDFDRAIDVLRYFIPVQPTNCLFINFWMIDEKTSAGQDLLFETFAKCPHIDYIVWVCPASYVTSDFVDRYFSAISHDSDASTLELRQVFGNSRILFIHRSVFLPKLLVRNARVEDNDDLIPIIQKTNPGILAGQNHYFLADLISSQDENNKFYVGLKKNQIQGFLSTSLDVNMALIMKLFNIDDYADLVIKVDQVPPPPPLLISIVGDLRLLDVQAVESMVKSHRCLFIDVEKFDMSGAISKLGDEGKSADDHEMFMRFIDKLLEKHNSDNTIQAIVFWGFPKVESEVHRLLNTLFQYFNSIVELSNISEEAEEDDEDDFLQHHLDAVEVLREIYFQSGEGNNAEHDDDELATYSKHSPPKAKWRKVTYEKDSYQSNRNDDLQRLGFVLNACLEERRARMDATNLMNNEKPPGANGFAVTALCLEEEFHSRSIDLIKFAFEQQQGLDYCLMMIPCQQAPTLVTSCFNYVSTRAGVSFDQSLYIMHRSFFIAQEHLQVKRIIPQNLAYVREYLEPLDDDSRATVLDIVNKGLEENDVELLDNPADVSFSMCLGKKVVGLAVFSRRMLTSEDVTWFRAHYHVDDHVNFTRHRLKNQYVLNLWQLDPIFSSWSRLLLRDIMRLCHKTVIYYHQEREVLPPKEILENFLFVRPRRQAQGPHFKSLHHRPASNCPGGDAPLFLICKNHIARQKTVVAKRVVVVGGTTQAMAILETLCTVDDVYFPNVFIISNVISSAMQPVMHGVVTSFEENVSSEEVRYEQDFCGCLSIHDADYPLLQELWAMGYAFRIKVIKGQLTDIDRDNKAIVLSDELVVEYDYLVLSTHNQDNSSRMIPSLEGVHPSKLADAGVFALGNPTADLLAMTFIKKRSINRTEPVVIAGTALKVLTAAEAIVRAGLEPARIVCAIREAADQIDHCHENAMCTLVTQSLQVAGLKHVFWKHRVTEVSLAKNGFLQSVEIEEIQNTKQQQKREQPVGDENASHVNCVALLLCDRDEFQTCERDVFAAINDSGLVFDGGLVVDTTFRTVDPLIYAASDYTKYSRIFREDTIHSRYNAREVGMYVALQLIHKHLHPNPDRLKQLSERLNISNQLLNSAGIITNEASIAANSYMSGSNTQKHKNSVVQFNSTFSKDLPNNQNVPNKAPVFSLPRTYNCSLPGEISFFFSALPKIPWEIQQFFTDNLAVASNASSTANLNNGNKSEVVSRGYGNAVQPPRRLTSLQTDVYGTVVEFSYAGLEPIETRNFSLLTGKHESLLNTAIHAHSNQLVDDWIDFFRSEWASALYQDNFYTFTQALKKSLHSDKGMIMMLNRVFEKADLTPGDAEVTEYRKTLIGSHGEDIPEITKKLIEAETIEYLRHNREFLTKYHIPGVH